MGDSELWSKLAGGIPLEGWEAIKSVPGALQIVTDSIGIVERETDEHEMKTLLSSQPFSVDHSGISVFILSSLCLCDELRGLALSALSSCRLEDFSRDHADVVFQFINCEVFKRRSDGLIYILSARLLPLIRENLYGDVKFILDGLNHSDPGARKQSVFILKQLIIAERRDGSNVLYCTKDDSSWRESWNSFFLLYDTFQEPQSHLLEPLFPLLQNFLVEDANDQLGFSWWECIVRRGFENTSVSVRKRVLEHIITQVPIEDYPVLYSAEGFVFGKLLDLVDNSYLYSAIDFTRLVSPFGLAVTCFYIKFFQLSHEGQLRPRLLSFIQRMEGLRSNMAIMFLLNSLLEFDQPISDLIGEPELRIFDALSVHKGFHNVKARSTLRWQLLSICIKYCDPNSINLRTLCYSLVAILDEVDLNSADFDRLCFWFVRQDHLDVGLGNMMAEYFEQEVSSSRNIEAISLYAKAISIASALSMKMKDLFGQVCSESILRKINQVLEEKDFNGLVKILIIIKAFDEHIRLYNHAEFLHGLTISAKLYSLLTLADSLLLPDPGIDRPFANEFLPVEVIFIGLQLILSELSIISIDDPQLQRMLVEYLDIMLIRSVQWLQHLSMTAKSHAESYDLQLIKVIISGIIFISLDAFCKIKYPFKGPIDDMCIQILIGLYLDKPSYITDEQWDTWPLLLGLFTEYKWKSLREYCKCAASIGKAETAELKRIFGTAIDLLPSSQYNSTVAIIEFLQEYFNILATNFEKDLLIVACSQTFIKFCEFLGSMEGVKSKWFYVYATSIIDCLFQESLVGITELHEQNGPLFLAFMFFLERVGPARKGVLPYLVLKLYPYLKKNTGIRGSYLHVMPEILMYGPIKNVPEERLADAMSRGP